MREFSPSCSYIAGRGRDAGRLPGPRLHRSPDLPQLRKELELQRLRQVGDPTAAAGTGLVANDALHRLQMVTAPQLEVVIEIDQPLGELVEVPVFFSIVVHAEPRTRDFFARAIRLPEVTCQ